MIPQMASLTLALIGSLLVMDAAWSSSGGRGVEYGEAEVCSNDAMGQGRESRLFILALIYTVPENQCLYVVW